MSSLRRVGSQLKRFRDRVTHEVPTGPHTDVRRRKINPSFKKILKKSKKRKFPEIKVSNTQADLLTRRGPDETVGGTRIKKQGPEIKISNKQADLSKHIRPKGVGHKAGGRAGFQHGGRKNLYEELGRVEGERSNKNRRAEISRVHGELNKGYKKGGRSGYGSGGAVLKGKKVGIQIK